MKINIILFLFLLSLNCIAETCYDNKNYFNFFYINGINVSRKDQYSSILEIQNKLNIPKISRLYNPTLYQKSLEEKIHDIKSIQKKENSILQNIINWSELQIVNLAHYSLMSVSILNDAFIEVLPQKIDEYSFTKDWKATSPIINFDY